ncbi:DUF2264 domain-containing protein [Catenulispora subtropica]|uniref:DUF2264 domain-containing protein n=1 Tax=Catenulispora subtropica TaxID=450798 RepID=A0ABP5E7A3_9ACTN
MAQSYPDSPVPGRPEWQAAADRWLLTARNHAHRDGALILPPGRVSQSGPLSDGMEGFCRSFLIAAARLAGADDGDPHGHAEFYADGLAAAMDVWPRAVSRTDWPDAGITQPAVEAANLAFGLALCRQQVWDRLDERTRERLADWLRHHASLTVWDSNWLLFTAIPEAFLNSVGVDMPGGHGAENVERVESWYLGDGWYNDGPPPPEGTGRNIDHYNAWVIQPFLWQWYRLRGAVEEGWRVERFRERLAAFAATNALLFAPDGAPLHLGRSLTYRHAVLGGLWAAALEGLDRGVARSIGGSTLRYFDRLGVDGSEPPSLGWSAAEFLPSVQVYSGPGSPYFAGMGFLGLVAPATDPLWAEGPERTEPSSQASGSTPVILRSLGWGIQRADGIVRVVNHGSDHSLSPHDVGDPHYAKFAYSTHTAPGTGDAWSDRAWNDGPDSHVALLDAWGRATQRGPILGTASGDGFLASWHRPRLGATGTPLPGARVVTVSMIDDRWELRCHLVTAPAGWSVREGGHMVADSEPPHAESEPVPWARTIAGLRSSLTPVHGYTSGAIVRHTAANAFGPHAATPLLHGRTDHSVGTTLHLAFHTLDRATALTLPPVTVTGTRVRVAQTVVDLAGLFDS